MPRERGHVNARRIAVWHVGQKKSARARSGRSSADIGTGPERKPDGSCKYPACENPIDEINGCPNQLQVSYSFIAEVNKALQAAHAADGKAQEEQGGYITCVIADKENGAYAQNILLSVASAQTILRPSLPERLQKCMEVGLAGQGSMTPVTTT